MGEETIGEVSCISWSAVLNLSFPVMKLQSICRITSTTFQTTTHCIMNLISSEILYRTGSSIFYKYSMTWRREWIHVVK